MNRIVIYSALLFLLVSHNPFTVPAQAQVQSGEYLLTDPGVVSHTFRNQFSEDMPHTLDLIKEMGITNIEFSNLFGKTSSEIRALLDERDMICTSYGVSYNNAVNNTEQVAEDAQILGAYHVRVASIPHDAPFTIEDARQAAADFNEAGRKLKEEGLMFSYHNHGYEFRPHEDGTLFDYIVENTEPENVNFEIDLLWVAQPGHDPVELLEKYPERFRLMHLKDLAVGAEQDFSGRTPRQNDVQLGTGQIDLHAVLRAAQNTNIEYYYIEDETAFVLDRVPKSMEYIQSLRK